MKEKTKTTDRMLERNIILQDLTSSPTRQLQDFEPGGRGAWLDIESGGKGESVTSRLFMGQACRDPRAPDILC